MINRFKEAQKRDYEQAFRELRNGRKTSHWIWYIFPQLKGLGYSSTAQYYGLDGVEEAKEYIADKELHDNLVNISQILVNLNAPDIVRVMGHIDAMKLKSSMTLFYLISKEPIFKQVLDMYFDGQMCQWTVEKVGNAGKAWEELSNIKTDITLEEIDNWKKEGRR